MQLFNGNEKIELAKEKNKIQVRLSKTQYVSDALPVIRKYVDAQETDDTLLVTLELPEKAISFSEQTLISKTRVEKLQLADKVSELEFVVYQFGDRLIKISLTTNRPSATFLDYSFGIVNEKLRVNGGIRIPGYQEIDGLEFWLYNFCSG